MRTQPVDTGRSKALPVGYKLGEYGIVAVLGEGGFGITYRARDTKLGVDVAIKEYFPSVYAARSESSTIVPRAGADLENYQWGLSEFLKEAQALAKFKHPHIVRVLRFLEANGTAYTIMEYEEGETLNSYLRKHGGVLAEPTLLQVFLPILNGLQAVHDAGLLHLDIKPDNIYLRSNEQPMLIDFGSSRQMRGDAGGKITLTPGYCALEQYPGHGEIGAVSDVYGMGATLYRCMTGKSPTDALQRHAGFGRTRIDPLPPASSFERPVYSPYIRACVDSALKLAATERPPSAYALQQGLMGKDMAKIAARAPASPYRPGTGFIGVVLPAEKAKKFMRRYTFFEKTVAITVFLATFAIVTPKLLIDTDHMSTEDVYQWIDDTKTDVTTTAQEFGDLINEKLFGVKPRPKVTPSPTRKRPPPAEQVPASAEVPAKVAFASNKQRFAEIVIPDRRPVAAGFLKHGATLAVATEDGLVQLWDVATGTVRTTLPTRVLTPSALGIFPSSQWLAAMDRNLSIAIFDPLGNVESTLTAESPHPIVALTVSTEGRLLAEAGEDGNVTLWELSQKKRLHTLSTGKESARVLLFTPDERLLLAGDMGGGLTLWTTTDGKLISHRQAHQGGILAAAFAPAGRRLATADTKGEVKLWTVPAAGEEWSEARTLAEAPSITNLAFSPDGEWLLGTGAGPNVYIWSVDTGALAHQLPTDRTKLHALALTRDGNWIAAVGDNNVVHVWK